MDENWTIELPDDGRGEPDADGDLVVTSGLGTTVVAVFTAVEGFDPDGALEDLKGADRPDPRAEFDEYGPDGTVRWAFLVDDGDGDGNGAEGVGAGGDFGEGYDDGVEGQGASRHGASDADGPDRDTNEVDAVGVDSGPVDESHGHDLDDEHVVALYGYVIAATGWVQVAVLYDDRRDHDRALAIWRSVRHDPA